MSTCSANNTGLPGRRQFLSTLAGAGALGLPTFPAAAETPDAELFDLEARILASEARSDVLGCQMDAAMQSYEGPEIPAALLRRDSDYPSISLDPNKCAQYRIDGEWRHVYEEPDNLTLAAQRWWSEGDAYVSATFTSAHRARVQEIKTAYEAWQRAIRSAEDAAGITAVQEALDRENQIGAGLFQRVAELPARTAEGVCVKIRVAMCASCRNAEMLRERKLVPLLEKPDRSRFETEELLSLSAILDAVRLDAGSSRDRRAA